MSGAKAKDESGEAGRRRLDPAARRALIEKAATKVFAERGYEAATMQEIAGAAGVVASVIYDYYHSKQELYVELLEQHGRALIGETIRVPADSDLRTELRYRIDDFLRAIEDDPFVWRLMFRDPPGDGEVGAVHARVQSNASEAIAAVLAAEASGDRPRDDLSESVATAVVAEMIKSSLDGLAAWWWEHREIARADLASIATALLWDGLARFGGDAEITNPSQVDR
jgi:AcrR family transcriptional regulator